VEIPTFRTMMGGLRVMREWLVKAIICRSEYRARRRPLGDIARSVLGLEPNPSNEQQGAGNGETGGHQDACGTEASRQ